MPRHQIEKARALNSKGKASEMRLTAIGKQELRNIYVSVIAIKIPKKFTAQLAIRVERDQIRLKPNIYLALFTLSARYP